MIDVLLGSLPADAENRIRSSHEFEFWCGSQGFSIRAWYERVVLRLIEAEMEAAADDTYD